MIRSNFRIEERPMSQNLFKIEDQVINMADTYITMVRGDTLSFGFELQDQYGNPIDIDGAVFVAKKNYNDVSAVFEKTLGSGIEKLADGVYTVRVAPEDTADNEAGRYYYGFRVIIDDDVFTLMRGVLELEPEVMSED